MADVNQMAVRRLRTGGANTTENTVIVYATQLKILPKCHIPFAPLHATHIVIQSRIVALSYPPSPVGTGPSLVRPVVCGRARVRVFSATPRGIRPRCLRPHDCKPVGRLYPHRMVAAGTAAAAHECQPLATAEPLEIGRRAPRDRRPHLGDHVEIVWRSCGDLVDLEEGR